MQIILFLKKAWKLYCELRGAGNNSEAPLLFFITKCWLQSFRNLAKYFLAYHEVFLSVTLSVQRKAMCRRLNWLYFASDFLFRWNKSAIYLSHRLCKHCMLLYLKLLLVLSIHHNFLLGVFGDFYCYAVSCYLLWWHPAEHFRHVFWNIRNDKHNMISSRFLIRGY